MNIIDLLKFAVEASMMANIKQATDFLLFGKNETGKKYVKHDIGEQLIINPYRHLFRRKWEFIWRAFILWISLFSLNHACVFMLRHFFDLHIGLWQKIAIVPVEWGITSIILENNFFAYLIGITDTKDRNKKFSSVFILNSVLYIIIYLDMIVGYFGFPKMSFIAVLIIFIVLFCALSIREYATAKKIKGKDLGVYYLDTYTDKEHVNIKWAVSIYLKNSYIYYVDYSNSSLFFSDKGDLIIKVNDSHRNMPGINSQISSIIYEDKVIKANCIAFFRVGKDEFQYIKNEWKHLE